MAPRRQCSPCRVEQPSLLQGLLMSREWRLDGAIFCCYDAFHRVDLRVKLTVPGGVETQAMDGQGALFAPTDLMWKGALVSGFLRAAMMDAEEVAGTKAIKRQSPLPSLESERALLEAVRQLFQAGILPAQLGWLQMHDLGLGCCAEDMDLLGAALLHHFRSRQRLKQAREFFDSLTLLWPEAACYVAFVDRTLGMAGRAVQVLKDALIRHGSSPQLLVALGAAVLEGGDVALAMEVAAEAVLADDECRPAWLLLAAACLRAGKPVRMLKALNRAPGPPVQLGSAATRLLVSDPGQEYDTTSPQQNRPEPDHCERLLTLCRSGGSV